MEATETMDQASGEFETPLDNLSLYLDEQVCEEEKASTPIYLALTITLLVWSVYFFISMLLTLNRASGSSTNANRRLEKRYANILQTLVIIVIVTIIARLVLDVIQLSIGERLKGYFGLVFISKSVLATANSAFVYGFLWLRQWMLYDQTTLKKVKTTPFKVFNIFVLILVVSLVAAGPVVETRYIILELSDDGCMLVRIHKWSFAYDFYIAFSVFYQLILLCFFLYPLSKTRAATQGNTSVNQTIKRSAYSASACFLNEIIFIIVHNLVDRPLMLNTVTTDMRLIVYYICLVASYKNWKKRFCYFCFEENSIGRRTLSRATSSSKSRSYTDNSENKRLRSASSRSNEASTSLE